MFVCAPAKQQMDGESKLGCDGDLGSLSTDALLRLFELLPNAFCAQIWERLSDAHGRHARALLRMRKKYPLRADLAPLLWPRLKGFLEHISATEWGRRELVVMSIDDLFLEQAWPYISKSMGDELCISDLRLTSHVAREKTKFSALHVTPQTLSCAADILHPGITTLILQEQQQLLSVGSAAFRRLLLASCPHIGVVRVDQGVVPKLLELLHECLPPSRTDELKYECGQVTFAEMRWVASWWRETDEKRIVIQSRLEPRWAIASRPIESNPALPPGGAETADARGAKTFSYRDAGWIRAVVAAKKLKRRDDLTKCPECGTYDPVARHLIVGHGYICKFNNSDARGRRQKQQQRAPASLGSNKRKLDAASVVDAPTTTPSEEAPAKAPKAKKTQRPAKKRKPNKASE
jgi:hypothetical protein